MINIYIRKMSRLPGVFKRMEALKWRKPEALSKSHMLLQSIVFCHTLLLLNSKCHSFFALCFLPIEVSYKLSHHHTNNMSTGGDNTSDATLIPAIETWKDYRCTKDHEKDGTNTTFTCSCCGKKVCLCHLYFSECSHLCGCIG